MKFIRKLPIFLLILFASTPYAMGWDTIAPKPEDDKTFFHMEGDINYTQALNNNDIRVVRHSYFWTHITGGYEVVDNFWVSSWISLFKTNYYAPNRPSDTPFNLFVLPLITYTNLHPDGKESVETGKLDLVANAGTIGNFTHGKGLLFLQMTAMGAQIYMGLNHFSIEAAYLGHGYWREDQLYSLYLYPFKKYFGIGVIWETCGLEGDRLVPGINFEISFLDQLTIYAEAAVAWVYYIDHINISNYNLTKSFQPAFHPSFGINENTSAGLMGIDWKFSFPALLNLKGNLVNQVRYYGKEHADYYYLQSQNRNYFSYYIDTSIDQKFNNQPHNFYMDRGSKIGAYFRQEIDITPYGNIHVSLKNEFLWIYPTGQYLNAYPPHLVELLTTNIYYKYKEHVDVGARLSNVGINTYEMANIAQQNTSTGVPSEGIMLQPARSWYIELYSHFKF